MQPISPIHQLWARWYSRYLADPAAWVLLLVLVMAGGVLAVCGRLLVPLFVSWVIAYVLEGVIQRFLFWCPRIYAVCLIFSVFVCISVVICLQITPVLLDQLSHLIQQMPVMVNQIQHFLGIWQARYPELVPAATLSQLIPWIASEFGGMGKTLLSWSMASIPSIFSVLAYLILVPILVFFWMKDKDQIHAWLNDRLPAERHVLDQVWAAAHQGLGRYVQGRTIEMFVVAIMTYGVFWGFGLPYALLMAVVNGIGVFIPYIGALISVVPAILIALFHWGLDPQLGWFLGVFLVIQVVDAHVLVPLLFAETIQIHPVAIILAILLGGGLWGAWGLFLAIPLAVLCKAICDNWPRTPLSTQTPCA